ILQRRIGAVELGNEVRGFDGCSLDKGPGIERNGQRKMWKRLAVFAEFGDFREGVAGIGNSFSAEAGLKATPSCCPGVSLNSEPARSMDGSLRLAEMRDQGMSIEAGLKMVITPATPAASRDFQRSPAV